MDRLLESASLKFLLIVEGKGGVGKTTHAASLAVRLASIGRKVLIISTGSISSLGDVLQRPLSSQIKVLSDNLSALEINLYGIGGNGFKKEDSASSISTETIIPQDFNHIYTSPMAKEIAILEAVCSCIMKARSMGFQHVVLDTALAGYTLHLWELLRWVQRLFVTQDSIWGHLLQVYKDKQELFTQVGKLIENIEQTSILLVTTAEMLSLAEVRRIVAKLKLAQLPCHQLIINQLIPCPEEEQAFWQQRYERQQALVEIIEDDFEEFDRYYYGLQTADLRGVDALKVFGEIGEIMGVSLPQGGIFTRHMVGCVCCIPEEEEE